MLFKIFQLSLKFTCYKCNLETEDKSVNESDTVNFLWDFVLFFIFPSALGLYQKFLFPTKKITIIKLL